MLRYGVSPFGHPFLRIRVAVFDPVNYTIVRKNERETERQRTVPCLNGNHFAIKVGWDK